MADTKANAAAKSLIKSVQETSKAVVDTTVTTQEHNLAFAQSVLENGIEVLKSHAESTRSLMQDLVEQARKRQVGPETIQVLMDSAVAAQERNMKLAQSILESGIEELKSQSEATQSLMQELRQQFQHQREALQTLAQESMDAYRDFIFAPLTVWQKEQNAAKPASHEVKKAAQVTENLQKAAR